MSNQVLRTLVKHHNLVNILGKNYYTCKEHLSGCSFLYFLTKLVQMWLQPDKVSCLKNLRTSYNKAFTTLYGLHNGVLFYRRKMLLIFSPYLLFSLSYGILLLVNKLTKRRTNVFTY